MKILKVLAPLVILALLFSGCPNPADNKVKSDAKSLVSFKFEAAKNTGKLSADSAVTFDSVSGNWKATLPAGTDPAALVATFEISALAKATVGGVEQVSGTTANNFSSNVVYTVTAEDGTSATYTIALTVAPTPSSAKDFTQYSLKSGTTTASGTISGTNIAVSLPVGSNVTALVATFALSDKASATVGGTAQVSGTTANNFTSPVQYVVTAADSSTKTYTVTVTVRQPSALIISEYYEGAVGNNKYLEITNTSAAAIDLSAYSLRSYPNGATTADTALALTGSLAAGKSVVYYNDGYTSTVLDTVAALSATAGDAAGWRVPVAYVSGSTTISFNGNDAMELSLGSDPVDFIGKSGDAANWGVDVKLIRKPGKTGVLTWDQADWYSVPVKTLTATAEDDSAGAHVSTAAGSTLTEFWLGGIKGTINGTAIAVSGITATSKILPAYFMTAAESVKVGSTDQVGGVTTNDYTNPVSFVVATGTTTQTYTVTAAITVLVPVTLTSTNYNFNGGVQAARTTIGASTAAINLFTGTDTYVDITGIVTSIPATNKFFIQDQNAGLCFYKSGAYTGVAMKVGDKVTVRSRKGMFYNSYLYEVTDFDVPTIVTPGSTIYAIDGSTTAWDGELLNRVYKYSGIIKVLPASANSYVGNFDSDATRQVTNVTNAATLEVDKAGTFFGAIDIKRTGTSPNYVYPKVMLLYAADQLRYN